MAGIFQRLVQLGRAHLNELLEQRWPGAASPSTWEKDFETQERTRHDTFNAPPPFEEPALPAMASLTVQNSTVVIAC